MSNKVYILSAAQISIQEPLCDKWMDSPISYDGSRQAHCIDPQFKDFISPIKSRRMGNLMKRAIAVSLSAMKEAGVDNPDAIITGTGLGCIENTELFLREMTDKGEELLSPTPFMQSTHNTISSGIAIFTQCHSYNCTYSQDDISFESALLDSYLMIASGEAKTVLAGTHDEATDLTFSLLGKSRYSDSRYPLSEGSSAMILADQGASPLCEITDIKIFNGKDGLDKAIRDCNAGHIIGREEIFPVFGKNKSASGLAAYAAARLIAAGKYDDILIVNDWGRDSAIVHLKKPC